MIVAVYLFGSPQPTQPAQYQKMVYYYDQNTKELFAVPAGTPSPIETDSGPYKGMPAGVRAEVYCCGKYTGEENYFIGLLEASTHAVPEEQRPTNIDLSSDADLYLVRRPDDEQWHSVSSSQFNRIMEEVRARCPPDKPLQNVYPVPRPLN